jgi:hypothetical protein
VFGDAKPGGLERRSEMGRSKEGRTGKRMRGFAECSAGWDGLVSMTKDKRNGWKKPAHFAFRGHWSLDFHKKE